jgi:glycosyltransferase involved in cell wall biosynthesis
MTVSSEAAAPGGAEPAPLISVVVPVYGTEAYLPQCLDSILAQTHANLEVLCVDDCSPGNAAEIIRDYAGRDARVRLISHAENQGLGSARNTGIRAARGALIGFVDSDDWLEPEMYARLLELMERAQADIVQCSAARMSEGRNIGSYPVSGGTRTRYTIHSMFGEGPTFVGAAWNKLYKTSLFLDNDIFYPDILFEDVATTPRLVHCAKRIASLPESYLNYRYRDDSIVNDISIARVEKRIDGLFSAMIILAGYFAARRAYSLEFVLNFRRYLMPQLERNIRIAQEVEDRGEALERCLRAIEVHLMGSDPGVRYFFPDQVKVMQGFRNRTRPG